MSVLPISMLSHLALFQIADISVKQKPQNVYVQIDDFSLLVLHFGGCLLSEVDDER